MVNNIARYLAVVTLFLMLALPAHAADLFCTGWEEGAGAGTAEQNSGGDDDVCGATGDIWDSLTDASNFLSRDTVLTYNSSVGSLRINETAEGSCSLTEAVSSSSTVYLRLAFNIDAESWDDDGYTDSLWCGGAATADLLSIRWGQAVGGALYVGVDYTDTDSNRRHAGTDYTLLSVDTWYELLAERTQNSATGVTWSLYDSAGNQLTTQTSSVQTTKNEAINGIKAGELLSGGLFNLVIDELASSSSAYPALLSPDAASGGGQIF